MRANRGLGDDGVMIQPDLSRAEGVAESAEAAIKVLGGRRLDTLILNAAATAAVPLEGPSEVEVQALVAVNFLEPTRLMQRLIPHLADGSAVLTVSVAATRQVFSREFAFFSATKAAVDVLVKAWAQALGTRGIRVNALAPAWSMPTSAAIC